MLIHVEEASSPIIASKGDMLELVVLGDDTIEETSHLIALGTAAEAMADCGDIPSVQLKAHYESLMQNFIDWLVLHRRTQITATLRKRV